ncbi:hypothetical protein EPN44_01715 [bacterium]|nr:MAG: hypothetical protein EPN44_01715 [bacterium]
MSGIASHDELRDLAMLYTLGALETNLADCAEARAIEAHLHECDACRDEVALAQVGTAMIARSAAEAPPQELKQRLLAAVAETPRRHGSGSNIARWTAVAAAITVLIAFAMLLRPHQPSEGPVAIYLQSATTQASGVVRAPGGDAMTVEVEHLAALPAGEVYQLWSIAPGAKPAPGPTFTAGSQGTAHVTMHASPEKGLVIAVTIEPAGGSQAPTTRPFLTGALQ